MSRQLVTRAQQMPISPVASSRTSVADAVVAMLQDLDVSCALGVSGGAVAPIWVALSRSDIPVLHFRHEAGAAFAAVESYFANGRPVAIFATTGPGLFNTLTGLMAARWEGAKVILLSATTSAPQRGRWAFQETSAYTTPVGEIFTTGSLFDYATVMEQTAELPEVHRRLALGLGRHGGFVAHVSIPVVLQAATTQSSAAPKPVQFSAATLARSSVVECARLLMEGPTAIWVGFGARHAAPAVRRLAERMGAAVMCSPRAKGTFPEDHPLFIGVTGFGGHASVLNHVRARRFQRVLVLGTRLGEFTSFWEPELVPPEGFIHVDIDPDVPGVAYPSAPVLAVQSDVGAFIEALLPLIEEEPEVAWQSGVVCSAPVFPRLDARPGGPVRPGVLMTEIQRVIVDGSDAVVISEAGNSFAWATHTLCFTDPGRYRVSTGFGSMGQATTGVLGAALGRKGKAVAIVGDGAMLMNNEISTAVCHRIPAVWIVLNDGHYHMCKQGNAFRGMKGADTTLGNTDFVAIARAVGAEAVRVDNESALQEALEWAMAVEGPVVVDVIIDPTDLSPAMNRFQSLQVQEGTLRIVPGVA